MDWNDPVKEGPLFAQVKKPMRSVHPNTREAFVDQVVSGRMAGRRANVIEIVRTRGPVTDQQVKEFLGLDDMNQVRPWITRCVQGRVFMELPEKVKDHQTGKPVRRVVLSEDVKEQMDQRDREVSV